MTPDKGSSARHDNRLSTLQEWRNRNGLGVGRGTERKGVPYQLGASGRWGCQFIGCSLPYTAPSGVSASGIAFRNEWEAKRPHLPIVPRSALITLYGVVNPGDANC